MLAAVHMRVDIYVYGCFIKKKKKYTHCIYIIISSEMHVTRTLNKCV